MRRGRDRQTNCTCESASLHLCHIPHNYAHVSRSESLRHQSDAAAAELSRRLDQLRAQLSETHAAAQVAAREAHEGELRVALQQQREAADEDK
jgi:hypothetical protein